MSKTIEEIIAYTEGLEGYDLVGSQRYLAIEVAKRYAQSQTQELIEQNRELVELLQENNKQGRMTLLADKKAMELLTKYNHLKSNTNDTDKI